MPPVASAPVLQWVRTFTTLPADFRLPTAPTAPLPTESTVCPASPIARHIAWSSRQIAWASCSRASNTAAASPVVPRAIFRIRSIAQPRFAAVGRAAPIASAALSAAETNRSRGSFTHRRSDAASPIAAATPIAGAPRTRSVRIASITPSKVSRSR